MTVRHVVCFRFHPGTEPTAIEALGSALRSLGDRLPQVRTYDVGPDVGVNPPSWDFAVSATFDDADGYLAYRDDPDHQAIIRDLVDPITDQRVSVQFEV
ncbi:MAG: Dabb family protein [Acidimicrobiales bacterium]|nr:Dabb family protein [Acidimicrobiales bacterium]